MNNIKSQSGRLHLTLVLQILVLMLIAGAALYVVLQENGPLDRALTERKAEQTVVENVDSQEN